MVSAARVPQDPADVGEEARALLAVDEPMIERQRERHDLAQRDLATVLPRWRRAAPIARIAASPGLRMGVPASMPNTPMFVIGSCRR